MKADHYVTVIAVVMGLVGTIVSGVIGYQSGSNAVNKDYVALAIATLDKKEASPDLRKWAVNVLSELSPVPFGDKLKSELTAGGPLFVRSTLPIFEIPKGLEKNCPDLLKGVGKEVPTDVTNKILNTYGECMLMHNLMLKYIKDYNNITTKFNNEVEDEYEDVTGQKYPESKR